MLSREEAVLVNRSEAERAAAGKGDRLGAVILAAGLGRRFGGDKLTQPLAGRPLGRYVIEAALAAELDRVVVVVRPEVAATLTAGLTGLEAAINLSPETGQADSMKLGLNRLTEACGHVLFLLADQPLVGVDLINRFCLAARGGTALAALAGPNGPTPPTLFARRFFPELLQIQGDQGGRSVMAAHRSELRLIDPTGPDQVRDVDRPTDLADLDRLLRFGQD